MSGTAWTQLIVFLALLFGLAWPLARWIHAAMEGHIGLLRRIERGLLKLAGLKDWAVPDFSTLCRRQKTVTIQIPFRRAGGNLNLLVDSTGVKMRGDGEWHVCKHGPSRRRQWRKVHLAMDTATGDIRAVEFTPSREGDSPVLPDLLEQIPRGEQIGTVTADGAQILRAEYQDGAGAPWSGKLRYRNDAWGYDIEVQSVELTP